MPRWPTPKANDAGCDFRTQLLLCFWSEQMFHRPRRRAMTLTYCVEKKLTQLNNQDFNSTAATIRFIQTVYNKLLFSNLSLKPANQCSALISTKSDNLISLWTMLLIIFWVSENCFLNMSGTSKRHVKWAAVVAAGFFWGGNELTCVTAARCFSVASGCSCSSSQLQLRSEKFNCFVLCKVKHFFKSYSIKCKEYKTKQQFKALILMYFRF